MNLIFLIVALILTIYSAWLIGRAAFRARAEEKGKNDQANSAAILISLISMILIFIFVIVVVGEVGGFRR